MGTAVLSPDAVRHRLLEGVLLRLARRPDARDFVVRGGVLLRHWLAPLARPADDLDLVAAFPFDLSAAAERFLPVLGEPADDGVLFDVDRTRVAGIYLDTATPGARVFTGGTAGGAEDDFHVDLTFGPVPRPAPVLVDLPTAAGGAARVWACRPEAVAGHKVQALVNRGVLGWRAKDLDDLALLLERVPVDAGVLRAAVGAYLADVGKGGADARAALGPDSWLGLKFSSARWLDYASETRWRAVPRDLAGVAAGVAARLAPALEGLP